MRAALLKLYANAQLKLATLRDQHEQNTAERALVFGLVALPRSQEQVYLQPVRTTPSVTLQQFSLPTLIQIGDAPLWVLNAPLAH